MTPKSFDLILFSVWQLVGERPRRFLGKSVFERGTEDHDAYQKAFERLLRDLKAEEG